MKLFEKVISLVIEAHRDYPRKPEYAFRKWDKQTPYSVHPLWCMMTFLQETKLPKSIDREICAFALGFHDVEEDTIMGLPAWLVREVVELVDMMTFEEKEGKSSTEVEIAEIWERPKIARLLKSYDKTSNLLDGSWMTGEKWNEQYVPYVLKLIDDVEKNYGKLNIVYIARAKAVPR